MGLNSGENRVLCVTDDPYVIEVAEGLSLEGLDSRIVESYAETKAVFESGSDHITVIDCDMDQETLRCILDFLGSRDGSRLPRLGSAGNPPPAPPWSDLPDYVDYAWKPVTTAELALRIKATILRAGGSLPEVRAIPEKRELEAENRAAA